MAYIKVDHRVLENTADAVDEYVRKQKDSMRRVDDQMEQLGSEWRGKDYTQVRKEWREINAGDSTSGKMTRSLENYADFLRYSAKKYKDAQVEAINKANSLPRY